MDKGVSIVDTCMDNGSSYTVLAMICVRISDVCECLPDATECSNMKV